MEKLKQIARAVAEAGGKCYLVGGYVRDFLLGKISNDLDVEVYGLEPRRLSEILLRFGRVVKVGKSFAVFKVKGEGLQNIDFAVPGKAEQDIASPSLSPRESVRRRDFTVNALLMDILTGEIYDYCRGQEDLRNKVLRHVSENVFIADPLRILRAVQLAARLEFTIHQETLMLMERHLFLLKKIPRERIYGEFKKLLLQAPKPSLGLRYLQQIGGLQLFPELQALVACRQPLLYHPEGSVWEHTLLVVDEAAKLRARAKNPEGLMWAALCHDLGKPVTRKEENGKITFYGHEVAGAEIAREFLQKFTTNKKLLAYVTKMVREHMNPYSLYKNKASDAAVRRLAARVDLEELLLLVQADKAGRGPEAEADMAGMLSWLNGRIKELSLQKITPLLKGKHLIEMGLKPGPSFGAILEEAFAMQLDGADFPQIYQAIKKKYVLNQGKETAVEKN